MSMTLHRLDREEIIAEFRWIADRFKDERPKRSSVVSPGRDGRRRSVVKVVENGKGTFLCLFDEGSPVVPLAKLMHSDVHEFDFPELLARLEKCSGADVWLQWPDDAPRTVVGKILAVLAGDTLVVGLTPVPKDIEEVNREVHRRVSEDCETARGGMECGDCPMLATCDVIAGVDAEIAKEKTDAGG